MKSIEKINVFTFQTDSSINKEEIYVTQSFKTIS